MSSSWMVVISAVDVPLACFEWGLVGDESPRQTFDELFAMVLVLSAFACLKHHVRNLAKLLQENQQRTNPDPPPLAWS